MKKLVLKVNGEIRSQGFGSKCSGLFAMKNFLLPICLFLFSSRLCVWMLNGLIELNTADDDDRFFLDGRITEGTNKATAIQGHMCLLSALEQVYHHETRALSVPGSSISMEIVLRQVQAADRMSPELIEEVAVTSSDWRVLSGPMRWQGHGRANRDEVPMYLRWGQKSGREEKGNEHGVCQRVPALGKRTW